MPLEHSSPAATANSSAAPINGTSIKAAVPAVTTDVRYRVRRGYPTYNSYRGYPTYYYYGYPTYYYAYPGYYAYRGYQNYSQYWNAYGWW